LNSSNSAIEKRLLKVGRVVKPHGVKGALLFSVENNFEIKQGQKIYFNRSEVLTGPFEIKSIRRHKNLLLSELEGISDMNTAEKYRGFAIGIRVKALPENFFWTEDLVGCEIYRVSGEKIGVVEEVMKTGANDVLVCGEFMVPVVKSIIESIDISNRKIVIKNIPGLFE